ncbi:MAG TPA: hypothetical protein VNJ09_03435, partial [Chthonomonadales bacterium]|nr:hypothetical protein [Chthonomonadales bacterium]
MSDTNHNCDSEAGGLWEEAFQEEVADVVVDADAPDLLPTYTYRVPDPWKDVVQPGTCVHVPFGGQEKLGYVLVRRRISSDDPLCARLRDIIAPVKGAITFSQEQAELARWMAARYVCSLAAGVRCVAPAAMGARVMTLVRLADQFITTREAGHAAVQAHIIETLRTLGGVATLEKLREAARVSSFTTSYAALLRKGLLQETRQVSRPRTQARTVRGYVLSQPLEPMAGQRTLGPAVNVVEGRVSEAGRRILRVLAELTEVGETPVTADRLLEEAQASESALQTLVKKGAVEVREVPVRRIPYIVPTVRTQPPCFTPGQRAAAKWIAEAI